MQTKFEEVIESTSKIEEMKGKFLAERLLRSWKEDFVDEDSGEVVSIERNELIFEKGTLLDHHELTEINFLIQSGDIIEVKISNQQRECARRNNGANLWLVSVELNSKKKNLYLYALSVENAIEIATDYLEQLQSGTFSLKNIKELDYINLIIDKNDDEKDEIKEDDKDISIYNMNIEVTDEEGSSKNSFILKSTDVESAKKTIDEYLMAKRIEHNNDTNFEIVILQAKTISCHFIVDPEFSKIYFEQLKEEN